MINKLKIREKSPFTVFTVVLFIHDLQRDAQILREKRFSLPCSEQQNNSVEQTYTLQTVHSASPL